jgi:hypothetical protein
MSTTAAPGRFTTLPDEPTLASAVTALEEHGFSVEVVDNASAVAGYGQHSQVGKILEIHQELPGRIHIVLIRQAVGF